VQLNEEYRQEDLNIMPHPIQQLLLRRKLRQEHSRDGSTQGYNNDNNDDDNDSKDVWSGVSEMDLGEPVAVIHNKRGLQGVVAYIGKVHFAKGVWIGIQLTGRSMGKGDSDGSVAGRRYFPKKGRNNAIFCPVSSITMETNKKPTKKKQSQTNRSKADMTSSLTTPETIVLDQEDYDDDYDELLTGPEIRFSKGKNTQLCEADFMFLQSLHEAEQNFVITDPTLPDNPVVYCSQSFLGLTGYESTDIIGKNCRFLQGPRTDERSINKIRRAIKQGIDCSVLILNYRKDGMPFWNEFFITALRDMKGRVKSYIGVQCLVSPEVAAMRNDLLSPFRENKDHVPENPLLDDYKVMMNKMQQGTSEVAPAGAATGEKDKKKPIEVEEDSVQGEDDEVSTVLVNIPQPERYAYAQSPTRRSPSGIRENTKEAKPDKQEANDTAYAENEEYSQRVGMTYEDFITRNIPPDNRHPSQEHQRHHHQQQQQLPPPNYMVPPYPYYGPMNPNAFFYDPRYAAAMADQQAWFENARRSPMQGVPRQESHTGVLGGVAPLPLPGPTDQPEEEKAKESKKSRSDNKKTTTKKKKKKKVPKRDDFLPSSDDDEFLERIAQNNKFLDPTFGTVPETIMEDDSFPGNSNTPDNVEATNGNTTTNNNNTTTTTNNNNTSNKKKEKSSSKNKKEEDFVVSSTRRTFPQTSSEEENANDKDDDNERPFMNEGPLRYMNPNMLPHMPPNMPPHMMTPYGMMPMNMPQHHPYFQNGGGMNGMMPPPQQAPCKTRPPAQISLNHDSRMSSDISFMTQSFMGQRSIAEQSWQPYPPADFVFVPSNNNQSPYHQQQQQHFHQQQQQQAYNNYLPQQQFYSSLQAQEKRKVEPFKQTLEDDEASSLFSGN